MINKINRIITGIVISFLSIWFIIDYGFISPKNDYVAVLTGLLFLVIGFIIIFNDKEDKIEEIKEDK
jgi:hypothetical protein